MTFRETEYPGILEEIKRIAATESDPVMALNRIKELIRIDERIPLYPGLVGLVGQRIVEECSPEELNGGEVVSAVTGKSSVTGKVKEAGSKQIVLSDAVRSRTYKLLVVPAGRKVRRINSHALEKSWPSLVFDKKG